MHHGDCLGVNGMASLADKSVDMICADLPYGTTRNAWDCPLPMDTLFKEYNRVIKDNGAIVLFGSQPFTTDLINANRKYFRYELIWDKHSAANFLNANRMPLKCHENILIFYKRLPTYNPQKVEGKPTKEREGVTHFISHIGKIMKTGGGNILGLFHPKSILSFKKDRGLHTTQKPVALCEWLIKSYTNEGDLVLDNTMGCGTTAVACLNLNRNFVGWEMDDEYYRIACERVNGASTSKGTGRK